MVKYRLPIFQLTHERIYLFSSILHPSQSAKGGIMVKIHRIGIFSLGKVSAVMYALFGLLGGVFMTGISLISMIFNDSSHSAYSSYGSSSIVSMITGLGAVVCLPILYGILGFLGGIITAFFLNLALKYAGGLEVEASGISLQPTPPRDM
jgi:hypothetical protein